MTASGEQNIRGIDIDKLAKGFADEENIFKSHVMKSSTNAREIRWYQKTAGFLDSTDSTGITASQLANVPQLALPHVVEQTWTRNTSYVRKYFVESPWLSIEDIKDSDPDILATNVRDLVRAVARQVDARIWDVVTESQSASNINSVTTTSVGGDQWDAASGQDIIKDIMRAKRLIRDNNYNPEGATLFVSPQDHESIMVWLISTKGASIPQFASEKVRSGVAMELLGVNVVVNSAVTADYAALVVPNRAATWKSFMPITSTTKTDEGIGVKIRVWEEGECILTDPKAVTLIVDTQT